MGDQIVGMHQVMCATAGFPVDVHLLTIVNHIYQRNVLS